MGLKIDPAEHAVISDLLRDFAYDTSVTVEVVYKKSWQRFNAIENEHNLIADVSQMLKGQKQGSRVDKYKSLPLVLHSFMYDSLFTFAGSFRRKNDPNGGGVHFGPQTAHKYKPAFQGDSPEEIESGVLKAVSYLSVELESDPLRAATFFYQKFINVHPFYDGNGRIARLMANIFLYEYGLNINWSEFDNKSKFIKLLNWCHKSKSSDAFNKLVDHLRKFTRKIEDLDSVNN